MSKVTKQVSSRIKPKADSKFQATPSPVRSRGAGRVSTVEFHLTKEFSTKDTE